MFYPDQCMLLLEEIALNVGDIDMVTGNQFYKAWLTSLEEVNEASGNVKTQIFYMKMLGALMVDKVQGTAIPRYQNKIFKGLFHKTAKGGNGQDFGDSHMDGF